MDPLFDLPNDAPPLPSARWLRVTATLGAERRVLGVQVDLISVDGTSLLSRGFWPAPGAKGSLDPIADALRFGQELVMD